MKLSCKRIDFTYTPGEEMFTFPDESGLPFLFDVEKELTADPNYGIIICFICGAIIGNFFIKIFAERAILCCSALLFFAFILMFIDYEREKEE